jgi:carbonic anhydrase
MHTVRRGFLRNGIRTAFGVALTQVGIRGYQKPTHEAMLISCIDPRMVDPVHKYMNGRGLDGKYSQFVIAGAAIAAEAKAFAAWHETLWGNLAASVDLHKIKRVIAIDHRDCGAARIAYGAESIADPATETATHRKVMMAFKEEVHKRHSSLEAETGLMALNGSIEMFT